VFACGLATATATAAVDGSSGVNGKKSATIRIAVHSF